jgi:hypothetical protein
MNSRNISMKNFKTSKDLSGRKLLMKNRLTTQKSFFKQKTDQATSFLIIICLLVLSTPAAPKIAVENALILHQSLLISFNVKEWFSFLSPSRDVPKQETQEERDATVASISIHSTDSTFLMGQRIPLFAVAYDQNGNPVTGVKFEWEIEDIKGVGQKITDGVFTPQTAGEYKIIVRGAVKESVGKFFVEDPSNDFGESNKNKTPTQKLLPNYDEWDVENFPNARRIKNLRGNPPGRPKGKTNFNISAPVLSIPGRGLNLDLSLYYNSLVWSRIDTETSSDISYDMDKDWLSPGWNIGFGKIVNIINGGIVQFDADGTRRFFAGTINGNSPDTVIFEGQSTDGTFIKNLTQTNRSTNGTCFYNPTTYLKYPNGTTISYDIWENRSCYSVNEPITMMPTRIQDRHGNQINISYCRPNSADCGTINNYPGRWIKQISDTLGRVYFFNYTLDNGRYYLTSITGKGLPNESGTPVTRTFVQLQYKNHTITHNFSGLTPHVRESSIKVLSAIYYPATQSGYWFGDSDSYSPYGMIRKVNEQRAMSYSSETGISAGTTTRQRTYAYPADILTAITDTPSFDTVTENWEGMTTSPSTTSYLVNWDSTPRTTTTTASDGSKVVEYSYNLSNSTNEQEKIKDGLTYKTEVFVAGETTPRSRNETEWELGHAVNSCVGQPSGCVEIKIPRPVKVTQSQFENGNTYTKATINYYGSGEYNQVLEMKETGYGGDTDILRKTVKEYIKKGDAPSGNDQWRALPRLINLPTVTQVYDGNNNRIAYSKSEYDLNPVEPFSGANPLNFCADFYCSGITERGNLSKTTTYENITNNGLSGEFSSNLVYDRAGNLVKQKPEATANTLNIYKYTINTQYAFPEESSIGADNTNFSTLSVKKTSTFNVDTGLPLTDTDANLQTTEFKHNVNTWRLESALLPTGGSTGYGYDEITRTYSQTSYLSSNNIAGKEVSKVNGLGLVERKETYAKTENGQDIFDVVEIKYDEFGRAVKTSNPFRSNENAHGVYWTEVFYDSIGSRQTAARNTIILTKRLVHRALRAKPA